MRLLICWPKVGSRVPSTSMATRRTGGCISQVYRSHVKTTECGVKFYVWNAFVVIVMLWSLVNSLGIGVRLAVGRCWSGIACLGKDFREGPRLRWIVAELCCRGGMRWAGLLRRSEVGGLPGRRAATSFTCRVTRFKRGECDMKLNTYLNYGGNCA